MSLKNLTAARRQYVLIAGLPLRKSLGVMLLLGTFLVKLCLYAFPKISFTCWYLPGRAQVHIYFWVGLLFCIKLLSQAAAFESRQC
jgi:hypothetical protein